LIFQHLEVYQQSEVVSHFGHELLHQGLQQGRYDGLQQTQVWLF
jgi:hypothetical protein